MSTSDDKLQRLFLNAETIARQRPLADRARTLRLAHMRNAAGLGDLLPTLEALDAYAQDGLPDASRVDPIESGGTANVYLRMSDVLSDLELSQEHTDGGVTRFAAIAGSAITIAATTAISTGTTTSVPAETTQLLLAWDLPPDPPVGRSHPSMGFRPRAKRRRRCQHRRRRPSFFGSDPCP